MLAHAGHGFAAVAPGIGWLGWTLPAALELALVALLGVAALKLTALLLGRD